MEKLSSIDDSSKLFLYSKLKKEIGLEEYLKIEQNFKYRQLLTKFRLSDHTLEVELGRYKNIPRNQRLCKTCKVLEDEVHFFLFCKINDNLRLPFVDFIESKFPSFNQLDSIEKIKIILNPDKNILSNVCTFIKRSLEART